MPASIAGLDRIELDIAPGANPAAAPSTFVWERAGSRRTASGLTITAGRDDEAADVEAGSMSAVMDDRNGDLSPRNVYGKWYGKLSRGCPVRVRWTRTADSFARTAASNGWGSTPEGYSWGPVTPSYYSVDGARGVVQMASGNFSRIFLNDGGSQDVDVAWMIAAPVNPTGGAMVTAAFIRFDDAGNYLLGHVELQPDLTIVVKITRVNPAGQFTSLTSNVVAGSYTTGAKVRARLRAEGPNIMVKAWLDGTTQPSGWQAIATDYICEGSRTGLLFWRLNTNAGTFTTYVDDYTLSNILWVGNVPEWAPRWPDKSGRDSTTPITGAGVLRRLQQGAAQLQSPLRRQLGKIPYASGYWPLEDESGSLSAASALPRGRPALPGGDVAFAGDDTLPGASVVAVLNDTTTSTITGTAPIKITNGWAAMALIKFDTPGLSDTAVPFMELRTTGTVSRWVIWANGTQVFGFYAYDDAGTLIAQGFAGAAQVNALDWTAVQIETEVTGGTVAIKLLWHQVGSLDYYIAAGNGGTYSYTGNAPAISAITMRAPSPKFAVGHLWIGDDSLPFVDNAFSAASNGYIGETASDRISRVSTETGIPVGSLTGASEQLGRQKQAGLLDLLRESESADQGVLYERGNALAYRPRSRRYNGPVAMALDWAAGHLDEPPEPQDDDQRLRNEWVVKRVDGSSAVADDKDSIAAVGLYDDSIEINLARDARLPDFANWLLHLGTSDDLRWPRIKINLVAHPELIPKWLACTIGSRITVANPPSQIAGEVIDLIIEGYTQTINVDTWDVELSCSPAKPWDVGIYSSTARRYDSRTTTLNADVAAGATSLVLTFTNRADYWSQVTASQPYDLMISGERIRVPSGGMGAVTGTGPFTQNITGAIRSVNGIAKALKAGASVHVATPGRYAL